MDVDRIQIQAFLNGDFIQLTHFISSYSQYLEDPGSSSELVRDTVDDPEMWDWWGQERRWLYMMDAILDETMDSFVKYLIHYIPDPMPNDVPATKEYLVSALSTFYEILRKIDRIRLQEGSIGFDMILITFLQEVEADDISGKYFRLRSAVRMYQHEDLTLVPLFSTTTTSGFPSDSFGRVLSDLLDHLRNAQSALSDEDEYNRQFLLKETQELVRLFLDIIGKAPVGDSGLYLDSLNVPFPHVSPQSPDPVARIGELLDGTIGSAEFSRNFLFRFVTPFTRDRYFQMFIELVDLIDQLSHDVIEDDAAMCVGLYHASDNAAMRNVVYELQDLKSQDPKALLRFGNELDAFLQLGGYLLETVFGIIHDRHWFTSIPSKLSELEVSERISQFIVGNADISNPNPLIALIWQRLPMLGLSLEFQLRSPLTTIELTDFLIDNLKFMSELISWLRTNAHRFVFPAQLLLPENLSYLFKHFVELWPHGFGEGLFGSNEYIGWLIRRSPYMSSTTCMNGMSTKVERISGNGKVPSSMSFIVSQY
jgi:hypothetical protein